MKRSLLFLISGLLFSAMAGAQDVSPESLEFFEKRIRPVLADKCFKCHSAKSEKLKGKLLVDHREHLLQGGETGAAIVPGDVDGSLLIESLRYGNVDLQMPPKEKLSKAIVQDFEQWVAAGAPWPDEPVPQRDGGGESFDLEKRRAEHWSWRPVEKPVAPEVDLKGWGRDEMDAFVLRKLEDAGLRPAEEAGRAVWLRRVYFDLIGLPPSPEEIEAFEMDESPEAYEKVVDHLLASSHFGEKWARHWLDLVRYAESYGHEFDYQIPHAFEYRDYLIRAFNADVPYDQFVREHIAGDLLKEPRMNPEEEFNESVLGTGFWYLHEATHAPTDVLANESDIMDNQLDVFGKSFLGLTVACARCHDHKFDAISTADYYAMTAYLHSSARQEHPIDAHGTRKKTREKLEQLKKKADSLLAAEEVAFESTEEGVFEDFSEGTLPEGWSMSGVAFAGSGTRPGIRFNAKNPVTIPGTIDSGVFGKAQVGSLRSPTFVLEDDVIRFRAKGSEVAVRLIIDNYQMVRFHQLLFKGTNLPDIGAKEKFRWVTMKGNLDKYIGHRMYLEFVDEGNGDIIIDEVRIGGEDPGKSNQEGATVELDDEVMEFVVQGETLANSLPEPRLALAMAEGTPEGAAVYVRGSHRSLGEEVPRRFLTALGGSEGDRLELANKVADADNPLTSRVIMNRLWHHIFGRGIVPSVDDFGPMGQLPTHPELLDWMAAELVDQEWSLKAMVRKMVLSSTYRQSSNAHPELNPDKIAMEDEANELLHRMSVKRLTGEVIRDSILAVSGELDDNMFGRSIPTHRTDFMTGRGGRKSGPLDGEGRRSIYGAVYRNFLSPFMLTFDVPNPFGPKGRRSVSNVPAQALVMLNDPFIAEQSKKWGESVAKLEVTPAEAVVQIYLTALGREPDEAESERVISFYESETAAGIREAEAWANVVHVVVNMKEFIFIH